MNAPAPADAGTPDQERLLRQELKSWITANWDPELSLIQWRTLLVEGRWSAPSWPERWYGRGLKAWADRAVAEELRVAGVPGPPSGVAVGLAAPTLLAEGSEDLKERFLRPILTGEHAWCQLFSEPSSGSDLAGLTTRASRDGEEWVINGQKVWNTGAKDADYAMLVARSDWDAPKHRGITYFVLPMRQQGIEVHPLRQMNNYASFNQIYMTEARIPGANVVGQEGGGWGVALTTLAFERRFGVSGRAGVPLSGPGRALEEARAEAEGHNKTYEWYPQRAGRVDLALSRARETGRWQDPLVRQEVTRLLAMYRAAVWTTERAQAARAAGRTPGPEGSIGKLATSRVARQASRVHSMITGANAMLSGADGDLEGIIAEILVSVPAQSVAGGTDEIQHNILAERFLGLPKDPSPDRGLPFRDIQRNG